MLADGVGAGDLVVNGTSVRIMGESSPRARFSRMMELDPQLGWGATFPECDCALAFLFPNKET
jgi:hypothetical protein